MSTQYDTLADSYDDLNKLPGSGLDYLCVQRVLKPLVQAGRTKALDLACGTGRFTRLLRSCGAEFALGVDISPNMVASARDTSADDPCVQFEVGNCSDPNKRYEAGPFDIVVGCWLLNYAASGAEMEGMVRHAANNLKDNGILVCLVPSGSENPAQSVKDSAVLRPKVPGEVHYEDVGEVEDGIQMRVWVGMQPEPFSFDTFYLKKSVYENAARNAGLGAKIQWTDCTYSSIKNDTDEYHELWERHSRIPQASILVMSRA